MTAISRREFFKSGAGAGLALRVASLLPAMSPGQIDIAGSSVKIAQPLQLDASATPAPVLERHLNLGATGNPNGRVLTADSRSLLLDGRPWLPVMGEFHYSRYPETEWRTELLKMKSGGIDVVATYVFWIHHEEIEGDFDWSGQRDLRRFVELCGIAGLQTVVRCGPWCHGEVRNGGLPDWLLQKTLKIRSDDPSYLDKVRRLYGEIAAQLSRLLWKDGGPVVGIQLENEYRGPAEHLLTLKRMARESGLDVPLYTRTGWPELRTKMPRGEMLPLFGAYAEGFWDRELTPMPAKYGDAFLYKLARTDTSIEFDQSGARNDGDDVGSYPYFCCEIGGGMMSSYHRRILIAPEDIDAVSLVKLGSGNNLHGYYMYHGGTNPEGKLTTLQESQATKYWNDLPVKSYDFQAPLGEFGQLNQHYHSLRRLHLFLRDFGSPLATMPAYLPAVQPANAKDAATLRWSVRTDGESGFIFVNNYQRLQPMRAKEGVQFQLKLRNHQLVVPSEPITVPANRTFFWPFNLDLAGAKLVYATAQLVCRLEGAQVTYIVFAETPGVPAEFVFARHGLFLKSTSGKVSRERDILRVRGLRGSTEAALRLRAASGKDVVIVLLDEAQSLACWKEKVRGREHVFLTQSGLTVSDNEVHLSESTSSKISVGVLAPPAEVVSKGIKLAARRDGVFVRFTSPGKPAARRGPALVTAEQVRSAGRAREIRKGSQGVAEAPTDAEFSAAAVWQLKLAPPTGMNRNSLLRIRYQGDVARVYLDGQLLIDNFYNGNPFDLGLNRYAPEIYRKELLLKILPLRKDAPVYLATEAWPDFGGQQSVVSLDGVDVVEQREVRLEVK